MTRKLFVIFFIIAFFVGAVGSIVISRFVIPYLATMPKLQGLNRLATNSPIIVNRREEVQLNEGVNLIDLIKQAGNVTVSIFDSKNNFLGNGVIVTSDGLIMAPNSVIQNQVSVNVTTSDGQKLVATVKNQDPVSGLTLLTIPATGLPTAQFDDASKLETGHRVIFMGRSNAAFQHQAMAGFVTQSLANQLGPKQISTDAVISADYFGGPIVNLNGRVVGLAVNNNQNIIGENLKTVLNNYLANIK